MFVEFNFETRQYTLRDRCGGAVIAKQLPAYEAEKLLDAPIWSARAIMEVARDTAYRAHVKRVTATVAGES